jgi:ribonuclease BN (tRNA processing enzyme)
VGSRMRVCLLGTGGAANEARHQAGVLVAWGQGAGGGQILLDTGAGLDIVRVLIAGKWEPAEVRDIFVSHRHLDHVGGLEPLLLWNIIKALRSQRYPPSDETRVYADRRVLAAIEELFGVITTAVPRLFRDKLKWIESADGGRVELRGGARLTTFLVDHEPLGAGAMGCLVEWDGARLAYSGDTRPTEGLIEAARGVDVLIHESGGLDAHAAEVHRQGHSTAGDAARVAAAAGVGRLILTHVPAEPLAEPMLAEARAAFGGSVELASDLRLLEV